VRPQGGDEFGQRQLPELLHIGPVDQPLGGVKDVVLHHEEAGQNMFLLYILCMFCYYFVFKKRLLCKYIYFYFLIIFLCVNASKNKFFCVLVLLLFCFLKNVMCR